jgi:hypothetical protein
VLRPRRLPREHPHRLKGEPALPPVRCHHRSSLISPLVLSSQDFLRPIVTSKSWTGDYVLDFTTLLTTSDFGQDHVDPSLSDHDEEGPVFSSVTGKYRTPKRYVANGVTGKLQFPLHNRVCALLRDV